MTSKNWLETVGSNVQPAKLALKDSKLQWSFCELLEASNAVSARLPQTGIFTAAILCDPNTSFVAALLGVWQAGGIAVPLSPTQTLNEHVHCLSSSKADFLFVEESAGTMHEHALNIREKIQVPILSIRPLDSSTPKEAYKRIDLDSSSLMLFTSGTTHLPKPVLLTHRQIQSQLQSLKTAWRWSEEDKILNVLPLYHTHGLINVLLSGLFSGATVELAPAFDPKMVWENIRVGQITLFMAVPTIYAKLFQFWSQQEPSLQNELSKGAQRLRVMISGSAALSEKIFSSWKNDLGVTLLERYGMTETGMALGNPLDGERKPGTVGLPMPGVKVRLLDEKLKEIFNDVDPGQLWVQSPGIFKEYFGCPQQTAECFFENGFLTGDLAAKENGYYRILGRLSQDILKSGGYKISALEIESCLKSHPDLEDAAVVGRPDEVWGEKIVAFLLPKSMAKQTPSSKEQLTESVGSHLKNQLAPYKIPREFILVETFPRTALGKIQKAELKKMFSKA